MAESATRSVLFDMKVIVDPESRSLVMSFAKQMKDAQDSLVTYQRDSAKTLTNIQSTLTETLSEAIDKREKLLTAAEEADRVRSQAALRDAVATIDARVRAEQEAAARVRAARDEADRLASTPQVPVNDSPVQAAEEEANHLGLIRRQSVEADRTAMAHRSAAVRSYAETVEMATRASESLNAQVRNARRELFATMAEMSGSIMQVARGFVTLGLAGEKDLEKVMQGLMQVQAAFDLVSGSTRVLLSLEKSMHLYRQATEAATAAQNALNVAQATGATVSGTSLLSSLGGLAGGLGARAKALFTSKAAQEAAEAAATAAAMRQAAMLGTSGAASVAAPAAAGAAGTFLGMSTAKTIGGVGVGTAGVAGAAAAALAASLFALKSAVDAAGQSIKYGVGGGADKGSWTERWGSWDYNPFNQFDVGSVATGGMFKVGNVEARAAAAKSTEATTKMEGRAGKFQDAQNQDFARLEQHAQSLAQSMAQARAQADAIFANELEGLSATEKRERLIGRLYAIESNTTKLRKEAAALDDRWAVQREATKAAALESRMSEVALLRERIAVERQIGEEARAAAQEKLAGETAALDKIQAQLSLEKDRFRSAKERFALMNEGEQQQLLALNKRLQAGAKLSAEELNKLGGFRDMAGVKPAFDKELERRAAAGKFDELGGDQKRVVDALERKVNEQRNIVAELTTEVNVTITADTKKIVDALTLQVGKKLKAIEDELTASVKKLGGEVTEIKQRIQNRAMP